MSKGTEQHHHWEVVGDIMVTQTSPGPVSDELWNRYLTDLEKSGVRIAFGMTWGEASLSSTQRKLTADLHKSKNISAVVLTNSRLSRGIITAISWFGVAIKAFSWDGLDEAIKHTTTDAKLQHRLRELADGFLSRVGEKS